MIFPIEKQKKIFPVPTDRRPEFPAVEPSDQRFVPDIHGDCQEYRCHDEERHSFNGPQEECGIPDKIGCCHAVSFFYHHFLPSFVPESSMENPSGIFRRFRAGEYQNHRTSRPPDGMASR